MKIGILGAGQLGRMLALAGYPLGAAVPLPRHAARTRPAGRSRRSSTGAFDDAASLARLAAASTSSPSSSRTCRSTRLRAIAASTPCLPPVEALRGRRTGCSKSSCSSSSASRRRRSRGRHRATTSSRGRGARPARRPQDAPPRLRRQGPALPAQAPPTSTPRGQALGGVPLILEGFVDFDREVSIIGARSRAASPRATRSSEHAPRRHPARDASRRYRHARCSARPRRYLSALFDHFDYAGVLTLEFFVAARTAGRQRDGAARAQLRALDDRRRGDLAVREPPARRPRLAARRHTGRSATRAMLNLIGDDAGPRRTCSPCRAPTCTTTARTPRPGRKLGPLHARGRHAPGPRPPAPAGTAAPATADRTCCPSPSYDRR